MALEGGRKGGANRKKGTGNGRGKLRIHGTTLLNPSSTLVGPGSAYSLLNSVSYLCILVQYTPDIRI